MEFKHFDRQQIRLFVKELTTDWGTLWYHVSSDVQIALIDSYVVGVILTLMGDTVDKSVLREIRTAMMDHLGLLDEEETD